MPLNVSKRNRMYRLTEPGGTLAIIKGTPVDGGGHKTKAEAEAQRQAIEAAKRRRTATTAVRG